jgi:hypothetical protein
MSKPLLIASLILTSSLAAQESSSKGTEHVAAQAKTCPTGQATNGQTCFPVIPDSIKTEFFKRQAIFNQRELELQNTDVYPKVKAAKEQLDEATAKMAAVCGKEFTLIMSNESDPECVKLPTSATAEIVKPVPAKGSGSKYKEPTK